MKLRVIQLVIGFDDEADDPAHWNWPAVFADMPQAEYKVLSVASPSIAPAQCLPKWELRNQAPATECSFPPPPAYSPLGRIQ